MKEEKPFLITLGILLIVLIVVALSKAIHIKMLKPENVYEAPFKMEELRNIFFETEGSDIIIEHSEDEDAHVTIMGINRQVIFAYNNGPDLQIRYMNEDAIEGKDEYIKITIPSNYEYNLEVKTNSGKIKIDDYSKATMTIESESGNVEVGSVKNLTLKNRSGESTVSKVSEKLVLKAVSGNTTIDNLYLTKTSKIETNSGNIKINKTKNVYVKSQTVEGNVNINKNGTKKNTLLTIKTNKGDISVN